MSKIKKANKKIEAAVVGGYKQIEKSVVEGYKNIEDGFIKRFLAEDDESVDQARARLRARQEEPAAGQIK